MVRATEAARAAQADLVIGVGAGSVIQGARIVTILLAEKRPIEELITRYPEHGPAISARLMEPKLPDHQRAYRPDDRAEPRRLADEGR